MRTRRPDLLLVLLASLTTAGVLPAQTGVLVPTSTGRPDPKVLSLSEMTVDVGVARGYARVNVRQVFENHTGAVQEGTWRFTLPPSGAVGDFAVWDGNVRIPGVILEKRRARAIYRELTTQRIDPGLLQQGEEEDREPGAAEGKAPRPSGGAAFSVKVAPIPAWGTKRLEMQYQHEVPWVDGVGELRVPLSPGGGGTPAVAGSLAVRVTLLDGEFAPQVAGALDLARKARTASFTGTRVALDRDVVLRFRPSSSAPLAFTAFRNLAGTPPDGLALAPWERPADLPRDRDGFFLLEYRPGGEVSPGAPGEARPERRAPAAVAVLFDTSLSHRWGGLEAGYAFLGRLLSQLGPDDRLLLVPFDREAAPDPQGLVPASPSARQTALAHLLSRPLQPGTDVPGAVRRTAELLRGTKGARIVLVTDGIGGARDLKAAAPGARLFAVLTGEERPESFRVACEALLSLASAGEADETLLVRQLLGPAPETASRTKPSSAAAELPVRATGGDPRLKMVYPVLTQPPTPGSLSGWIGRYEAPASRVTLSLTDAPGRNLSVSFPENALDARDLPRRWARARVDHLLALIELEGERREWVEEILELSRRYKFVTPYTAFLAAPRSLLRPRRIQPGDPVIRVEADPATTGVTALLPFGERIDLARRPGSNLWEGRFLVPEGLPDGPMALRLVLRDASGGTTTETKRLVVDGTPPTIRPEAGVQARAGQPVRLSARADADVVFLSVRLDDGPPVPLRWDPEAKGSTAVVDVPPGPPGARELFFEASDAAGNHGFARATMEVR